LTQPRDFDQNPALVVSNMPTDKQTPIITAGDFKSCLIKTDQPCTMTPPVPNRTNDQKLIPHTPSLDNKTQIKEILTPGHIIPNTPDNMTLETNNNSNTQTTLDTGTNTILIPEILTSNQQPETNSKPNITTTTYIIPINTSTTVKLITKNFDPSITDTLIKEQTITTTTIMSIETLTKIAKINMK
jgi:hypothetical protein